MDLGNWHAQLRKGLLDLAILNYLRAHPGHGYEIVQVLKKSPGLRIHEGNIYPILARLKTDGLVSSRTQPSTDGPPKKFFELTEKGKTIIRQMNDHWDEIIRVIHNFRQDVQR